MATQLSTLDLLTQRYRVLLTIPEVAEITSMQPQTIRNRLARGDFPIPSLKIGRRRLFRVVDVAAFLDRLAGVDSPCGKYGLATAARRVCEMMPSIFLSLGSALIWTGFGQKIDVPK